MADSFDGNNRAADFVLVPEVAGLPFLVAKETAFAAGLVLANPDQMGHLSERLCGPTIRQF